MNFSKLDEHASNNQRGTGLGLSICKSLVELMGGSVTVESELGKGTSFIMSMQTNCNYLNKGNTFKWLKNFKNKKTILMNENDQHLDLFSPFSIVPGGAS